LIEKTALAGAHPGRPIKRGGKSCRFVRFSERLRLLGPAKLGRSQKGSISPISAGGIDGRPALEKNQKGIGPAEQKTAQERLVC